MSVVPEVWLRTQPVLDEWVSTFRAAGFTERTVSTRVNGVRAFHSATHVDPLTATSTNVVGWLASPALAPASRESYFSAFQSWSRFLVESGRRDDDPTAKLRKPKRHRGAPRPLSIAQITHLLDDLDGRTRMYVLLGAYQGLRVHEIAKIRGEDVTQDSLRVLGKGGVEAVLPTHPVVWAAAGAYPRRGWWFPARQDPRRPVKAQSVTVTIARAMRRVGIEATAHQLRHLYGTQVLRAAGGNLRVAQELLRHSSVQTTALYTLVEDEQRRSAVMALPDYTTVRAS